MQSKDPIESHHSLSTQKNTRNFFREKFCGMVTEDEDNQPCTEEKEPKKPVICGLADCYLFPGDEDDESDAPGETSDTVKDGVKPGGESNSYRKGGGSWFENVFLSELMTKTKKKPEPVYFRLPPLEDSSPKPAADDAKDVSNLAEPERSQTETLTPHAEPEPKLERQAAFAPSVPRPGLSSSMSPAAMAPLPMPTCHGTETQARMKAHPRTGNPVMQTGQSPLHHFSRHVNAPRTLFQDPAPMAVDSTGNPRQTPQQRPVTPIQNQMRCFQPRPTAQATNLFQDPASMAVDSATNLRQTPQQRPVTPSQNHWNSLQPRPTAQAPNLFQDPALMAVDSTANLRQTTQIKHETPSQNRWNSLQPRPSAPDLSLFQNSALMAVDSVETPQQTSEQRPVTPSQNHWNRPQARPSTLAPSLFRDPAPIAVDTPHQTPQQTPVTPSQNPWDRHQPRQSTLAQNLFQNPALTASDSVENVRQRPQAVPVNASRLTGFHSETPVSHGGPSNPVVSDTSWNQQPGIAFSIGMHETNHSAIQASNSRTDPGRQMINRHRRNRRSRPVKSNQRKQPVKKQTQKQGTGSQGNNHDFSMPSIPESPMSTTSSSPDSFAAHQDGLASAEFADTRRIQSTLVTNPLGEDQYIRRDGRLWSPNIATEEEIQARPVKYRARRNL